MKDIHNGDRSNYTILTVRIKEIDILLLRLYRPNIFDNPNIILAGDWNMVLDTFKDYQIYKHVNNPPQQDKLLKIWLPTLTCVIYGQI